MATKVILRFNGFTNPATPHSTIGYTGARHAFGFSESFWRSTGTTEQVKTFIRSDLAPARRMILPSNVTIVDALLYTSTGGRGIPVPLGMAGAQAVSDQANVGALCSTQHPSAPAQRKFWIHCLPDDFVIGGELSLTNVQATWMSVYLNRLGTTQWLGLVQNDLRDIITVSATGLVALPGVSPYNAGQLLRVTRTVAADGRRKGGQFFVSSVGPGDNNFTLGNWQLGATTSGKIFRPTYDFYDMNTGGNPFVERVGTKRVGRPFDLYRGRQPVKRS
jgi:hypothetical protein